METRAHSSAKESTQLQRQFVKGERCFDGEEMFRCHIRSELEFLFRLLPSAAEELW